jgi:hypothetical protein
MRNVLLSSLEDEQGVCQVQRYGKRERMRPGREWCPKNTRRELHAVKKLRRLRHVELAGPRDHEGDHDGVLISPSLAPRRLPTFLPSLRAAAAPRASRAIRRSTTGATLRLSGRSREQRKKDIQVVVVTGNSCKTMLTTTRRLCRCPQWPVGSPKTLQQREASVRAWTLRAADAITRVLNLDIGVQAR